MDTRIFLNALSATSLFCLTLHAQLAPDLIKSGDAFDQKFQATEALGFYLPAEKLDPLNADILLRIARQYRHLMTDAPAKEEKVRLGGLALGYSLRAASIAPNNSEAQLSVAITYGKMLAFQSSREKVAASPLIKTAADKALALDPLNDNAWHVLGRWHRNIASIGGVKRTFSSVLYGQLPTSTYEAAVTCFEHAIELNPHRVMHPIELGITYAHMGKNDDARRFIEKGLALPSVEKDDPEFKTRGREALTKLK